MKNLIIASTATIYGGQPLEYLFKSLEILFSHTKTIIFIPYARPGGISYDEYTENVKLAFKKINKTVKGIHEFNNPIVALKEAKGIFTGGGNTFVLVDTLYKNNLMPVLREVIQNGTPYLGTSAGSNICGMSLCTTNDMPIVYPPSFETLRIVPFNINPHYLDPIPNSKHMGETRETRIKEFQHFNNQPVIGLREGSYLEVKNNSILLKGHLTARVFEKNKNPYEIENRSDLSFLK